MTCDLCLSFVAIKVDIDHGTLERGLVETIARTPELSRLVDEILFEYHFDVTPGFGWGDSGGKATVDDALRLMQDFRRQGVRSHFWI